MGGCRCSFRDCKVNTYKQNRMHFFHYPLKSLERYKKWREYAKTETMLSYNEVKKKNMVVCARHFRTECFMNYKMDRLTPYAIPTLMRLSTTHALDFEQDVENGVLITLEETKHKHLKAPNNFECPLDLDTDEDLFVKLKQLEKTVDEAVVEDHDDLRECEGTIPNPLQSSYSMVQIQSEDIEYVDNEVGLYNKIKEKPLRSSSNTVEILETMQVSAPHSKRPRTEEEEPVGICKKRILNTNHNVDDAINIETQPMQTIIVPFTPQSSQPAPGCVVEEVENVTTLVQNELLDQEGNPIFIHEVFSDDDDNDVEFFEIHNDQADLQDDFETNDNNTTIVQLKSDHRQENTIVLEKMKTKLLAAQQEIIALKQRNTEAEILKDKISLLQNENLELKDTLKKNEDLKNQLLLCQLENSHIKNSIKDMEFIKADLKKSKNECEILNRTSAECNSLKIDIQSSNKKVKELETIVNSYIESNLKDKELKEQLKLELNDEQKKHLQTETKLLQQISTLEQSLKLSRTQITTTKNNLSSHKSNINDLQLEKLNLSKQNMEIEQNLQTVQNNYDTLNREHLNLKVNYDCLQQKYSNLEQKYWKLEALQNQVATVTTSLENIPKACPPQVSQPSTISLTKAQLFNAIKRYLSASMVSLLRMEMFGSSEREWKSDERQVAVDLLGLGETVYKYLTDEWRFRLPALRDARNWLSQSVAMDDEEDL